MSRVTNMLFFCCWCRWWLVQNHLSLTMTEERCIHIRIILHSSHNTAQLKIWMAREYKNKDLCSVFVLSCRPSEFLRHGWATGAGGHQFPSWGERRLQWLSVHIQDHIPDHRGERVNTPHTYTFMHIDIFFYWAPWQAFLLLPVMSLCNSF